MSSSAKKNSTTSSGGGGGDGGRSSTSAAAGQPARHEREDAGDAQKPAMAGLDTGSQAVSTFGLFRFAYKLDILLVVIGCVAAAANGGTMSAYAVLIGSIFDSLNRPAGLDLIYIWYLLGLGGAVILAGLLQVGLLTLTADRTTTNVRKSYLAALLRQDVSFFDINKSGMLSTSIVENSIVFREAIGEKLGQLIQNLAMFIIGLCVGFSYSWKLALVTLSLSPLLAVAGFFMARTMKRRIAAQLQSYADAGAVAEETLLNMRTITALGAQPQRIEAYKKELGVATKVALKNGFTGGAATGLTMFIFFCSYGIAFYAGGSFIVQSRADAEAAYPLSAVQNSSIPSYCSVGQVIPAFCNAGRTDPNVVFQTAADVCSCPECGCGCYPNKDVFGPGAGVTCMSGGTVMTVFFSVLLGAFGLGQIGPAFGAISNGRVAAKKIYTLIDQEPTLKEAKEGVILPVINGDFSFSGVNFTYPTRPDKPVLKNLNLKIRAGTRVGLVGPSGSGKSTITQLLLRFYDPASGSVSLDGVDIKTLDLKWYRGSIGLISQEPTLFATSIKENIRFGLPSASDADIIEACKAANAYDFIMDFPDKFETFCGGSTFSQISGGQKQRIALARAFLRKPSILIADEATSALDVKSEQIVNQSIDSFSTSGRKITTIVIAHRLETIRKCDSIVVLENGIVVEQGTHNELIAAPNGVYAALHKISEQKPRDDTTDSTKVVSPRSPLHKTLVDQSSQNPAEASISLVSDENTFVSVDDNKESATISPAHDDGPVEKGQKRKKKSVPLSRVFQFAYPERLVFIPALFGAAVVGLIFPLFALIFANILNVFYFPSASEMLHECGIWALTFFGLAWAVLLSSALQGASFGYINGKMTARVREKTFEALLRSEMGFFDEPSNSVGVLTAKLASDASLVKAVISDRASLFVQDISTLVAGLAIAFVGSWKVALVVFAVFPFMVLGGLVQARAMQGVSMASNANLAEANQTVSESVAGIRTVLAFDMIDAIKKVYDDQLKKSLKGYKKNAFTAGFGFGFGQSQRFFIYALALWYGGTLMKAGEISFKDLNQAMFGILMSAIALGQALAAAPDIAKGKPAVESVFSILDRPSAIDWSSPEGEQPSQILGDIAFENVTFSYPTRPGSLALDNFSLKIPRGKTFALVGPSGSGKSTVVSMVERFYDPMSGVVKLDGVDLRKINIQWLRYSIGLVSQEPILMNDTILENIRYGKPDATDDECIQACKDANAHEFIMALPQQYQTGCGNKGGQLSGGQKQRVSIARALVKKPTILLLDESTSALDEESQKVVQDALDRLLKAQARTTIIIAHRFSTIRNADQIVVVDHGHVVEQGTFNQLAANENGAFAALLRTQHQ